MTKMMESEKIVEAYLRDRMKSIGGRAYKWVSPGTVGVPDRICVFPSGRIAFVEVKGTGGRLSAAQECQITKLLALECRVYVVWSRFEVDHMIEEVMQT